MLKSESEVPDLLADLRDGKQNRSLSSRVLINKPETMMHLVCREKSSPYSDKERSDS